MAVNAPTEFDAPPNHHAASAGALDGTDLPGAATGSRDFRMLYSRLIGALFLAGFLTYGVGSGLVNSVVGGNGFLATVPARQTVLILGVFLMLLNTAVDVAKGVLFYPILERHSKRTALTYLSAVIVEVTLLAMGALCLLMIVPLAKQSADAGTSDTGWAKTLGTLAVDANNIAYQIAEIALAVGAIALCALLYRTRLVPTVVAQWGLVGYPILIAGCIAELFGLHIGLWLSIPGGLFELALGFWLLVKGFDAGAYGSNVPTTRAVRTARRSTG
jgi:Domain of unknown function (DUF4386)